MEVDHDLSYAKRKLTQARIEDGDAYPIFQSLTLNEGQEDICLLQLNNELMAELEAKNSLIIRGEPDESAVLCTKSRTYELREAETSNSLLLVPNLLMPDQCSSGEERIAPQEVSGIFHTYFELRSIKPSFKKLRAVLERSSYKGKEYEDDSITDDKLTFDHLLDIIQCSEEELIAELTEMQTCIINGFVRVLDFDYKFSVFSQILEVIESQSLPIDKIPKETVLSALEDLEPKQILEDCFSWFTEETVDEENGHKLYSLRELPVCRIYAEILLRSSGKFHLEDFLESWQRSVPEGMTCNLEQLRGIALTDLLNRPAVIFYFPMHDLPENVSERFEHLFRIKEKWSYDEIVPFLEDRASAVTNVKALLIKYTRESTKNGIKYYSSKW
ncbi:sister chromatid cohesion protein DCC1 [Parasteatoda tepidariorum]|uniref:sister chromatid cohesion protein DCC1 n=1 Tax=Parasteatoda tepidariorum TaxID=114398 RepID=UPI001C722635|nr:sister chromatid cohesion protein DCC1 [Parasteatoda tepidariorum]